jgi:hypothetical protein
MQAPAGAVEELERGRHRVVLVLGELVQQHLALVFELGGGKGGTADDVAEHLHEAARVGGHAAHVERGVVLVGVGVDLGAEPFGVEVDAACVARRRALEDHVLDDVADAVERTALVRAAAAHEHGDVRAFELRHADRDDAHPVGQRREEGVGVGHARMLAGP